MSKMVLNDQQRQPFCLRADRFVWPHHINITRFETSCNKPQHHCSNQRYSDGSRKRGGSSDARSPCWPLADQTGCDKWLQHLSLSAAVLEGGRPSCCELHHPNNIIFFMRLVDRSHVWLAWGSAQVNWKPELCNGTGSWADIVPLVITQEACVSVYRLHLRFTAPVWEWNIRGQVMDVSISSTEAAEMDHSYHWTHLIFSRPYVSLNAVVDNAISLSLSSLPCSVCLCCSVMELFYVRDAAEVEILLPFSI